MPPQALIDIGSNAARMLVGALENGNFTAHLFTRVPLGLGRETYGANRTVAPAAQKKLIAALSGLQKIAEAMDAKTCKAVATAAVRDCKNRRALLANIRRQTGLEVRVLSGAEEAAIVGAFAARQFPAAAAVLNADTGGGSTDCAVSVRGEIAAHETFSIGTARKNGGTAAEKTKMAAWLKHHCGGNTAAAASGGSARKLEEICGEITLANLAKFLRRAEKMGAPEQAEVFGLTPDRARNIAPAARIAQIILRAGGAKKLHTINGGLGEAVLRRMLAETAKRRKSS